MERNILEGGKQAFRNGTNSPDKALHKENEQLKRVLGEKVLESRDSEKARQPLSMQEIAEVYEMYQDRMSLRGFCCLADVPRHRLRY